MPEQPGGDLMEREEVGDVAVVRVQRTRPPGG
jgi:hypothetical protein